MSRLCADWPLRVKAGPPFHSGKEDFMKRYLSLAVALTLAAATITYIALRSQNPVVDAGAPVQSQVFSVPEAVPSEPRAPVSLASSEGTRAVWINFYEMGELCRDKNADTYRAAVGELLDKCAALGLNSVVVHVRSHSDAFYPSSLFPWSVQIAGTQGIGVDFDPLALFIEEAHARNITFHAWINPYRVLNPSNDPAALSDSNPAKQWLADDGGASKGFVVVRSDGIYYNPAVPEVRKLIIDGVREIVEHYNVDGVHFDDYFYPTDNEDFDQAFYAAYQSEAGEAALPLDAWRRTQTNLLISGVYSAVKQAKPDVLFGISPEASVERNMTGCFADVERWACEEGYVDYLCPQIYFGFDYPNEAYRFQALLDQWSGMITCPSVALWVGLAPYKLGNTDAGSEEWIGTTDLLARQVGALKDNGRCEGVVLYNASTLFANTEQAAAERESLKNSLSE